MGWTPHVTEAELDDAVYARVAPHAAETLAREPDLTQITQPIHNGVMGRCLALLEDDPDPDTFDIAYQQFFEQGASNRSSKLLSAL